MTSKNASFGPTKSASKTKKIEADTLGKEANEMELRLKNLQERMLKQNAEDTATPKFGGSRWKSARPDKGSVLSYAKDVHEKHRKTNNGDDPAMRPHDAPRSAPLKEKIIANFRNKDIDLWTVSDVNEWLISAQLSHYSASFIANEISGPVLLDITLDDLDYMGVSILGHRKIILKSIEDLRKNRRITLNLIASHEGNKTPQPVIKVPLEYAQSQNNIQKPESKLVALPSPREVTTPTVHWSHLEPLCNKQVSNDLSSSDSINAADGGLGGSFLDEAAERAAFQEAVAGWRGSGGKVNIVREFENSSRGENDTKKNSILNNQNKNVPNFGKGNNNHDVTMWNNPFAPSVDDVDDSNMIDLEPLNFDSRKNENSNLKSLNYGKSSSGSEEKNEENAGIRGSRSMNQGESGIVGGFSLTEGGLDEAAEHEEFRKAVDAWRNRGKESNDRKMSTPLTEKVSIQLENISINGNRNDGKKNAVGASVSALAIAAKIEKEFENEQLMFQLKIKEQKGLLHASFKTKEEMKKKEMMKKREDKEEEKENGDTGKEMEEDEYEKIDSVRADDKCCSYRGSVRGSENSDSEEDSFYNNVTEAKYSSHSADPGRTTDPGSKREMKAKLLSTEHFYAENSLKNDSKVEDAKDVEIAYFVDEGSDTD